jgi:hypothetical protein
VKTKITRYLAMCCREKGLILGPLHKKFRVDNILSFPSYYILTSQIDPSELRFYSRVNKFEDIYYA